MNNKTKTKILQTKFNKYYLNNLINKNNKILKNNNRSHIKVKYQYHRMKLLKEVLFFLTKMILNLVHKLIPQNSVLNTELILIPNKINKNRILYIRMKKINPQLLTAKI